MNRFIYSLIGIVFLISCSTDRTIRQVKLLKGKKRSQYEAFGKNYMIATQGSATTNAANFIFSKGGNIFDAAVAASFAISVERPHSTGLGGGGFMLIHHAKLNKDIAFDFRELAPIRGHGKMFLDEKGKQIKEKSLTGPFAVGVPGMVAGVLEIHKLYGKLPLDVVLAPAIRLAEEGMRVYPALEKAIKAKANKLCLFEASRKIFLKENCRPYQAGEILYQKDLAKTLKRIVKKGKKDFYHGITAKLIVKNQKKYGGLISEKDLASYEVKTREPVIGSYKGYKIVSMPPPSSGGTHIIQILNILENFDLKKYGAQDARSIHLTSTAMQMAFADRAKYMGDSDFKEVPISKLINKKYAKLLAAKIKDGHALASKEFPVDMNKMLHESDHTTHFTLMDAEGNIVSSTQTINGWFGSSMVVKGTGIVLNNEMDDFASHVGGVNLFGAIGGKNNLVEPRKRPLSSMSPTIVYDKNDRPFLALGTPSGTRILTCVMQTVLNVLEYEMPLWQAVSATRYHHQWYPEQIRIGKGGFSSNVESELKTYGHKIEHKPLGCKVQAIMKKNNDLIHGVSDPREEGMSYGK